MRRNYRIATAVAWMGWLLVWLEWMTRGSAFQEWLAAVWVSQIAGLAGLLSVAAVPVLFILSVLECRRLRRRIWPDVLLLAVTAGVVAFLWFPAFIRIAGV